VLALVPDHTPRQGASARRAAGRRAAPRSKARPRRPPPGARATRPAAWMAGGRRPSYRNGAARIPYARLPSHSGSHSGSSGGGGGFGGGSGGGGGGAPQGRWGCGRWGAALPRAAYAAIVVLPWAALLLLAGALWSRARGYVPPAAVSLPGARQCVGWRETIYCHPFA
jgi:hypothetical protein